MIGCQNSAKVNIFLRMGQSFAGRGGWFSDSTDLRKSSTKAQTLHGPWADEYPWLRLMKLSFPLQTGGWWESSTRPCRYSRVHDSSLGLAGDEQPKERIMLDRRSSRFSTHSRYKIKININYNLENQTLYEDVIMWVVDWDRECL